MNDVLGALLVCMLGMTAMALAQHGTVEWPAEWENLVPGARFMDRFEPMPILGERTDDTWGVDAVKPRDVLNGIEDPDWSYWGGNILRGEDGRFHLFVCRWREDHPRGHFAWGGSEVVHCISTNRFGPYRAAELLGQGHNPEAYRTADGRYICVVRSGHYYEARSLSGPWQKKKCSFDPRDRRIEQRLSNLSFAPREDGSFVMVNRGGGIWISRDGLSTWEQVTQGSNYPKVKGRFEDPVIWRTAVQYHMIVNDWYGRIAYHLRSKNGVHWTVDPGEAYMPGIAVYPDGQKLDWYKSERIKVLQDDHGRAIQANFAVIDCSKKMDKAADNHSSKNLSIPLLPGRLLTLLNRTMPDAETREIRVRITAEPGFNPHEDIAPSTLRFGAPKAVDYGGGARLLRTEKEGADLIAVFAVDGHAFDAHSFAGKLLGRTSDNKLLFGYARLPWVNYEEPILTACRPMVTVKKGQRLLQIEIANHGTVESGASTFTVGAEGMAAITAHCPPLAPYEAVTVEVALPDAYVAGNEYALHIKTGLHCQEPCLFTTEPLRIP